jgi:uncharacterized protein (DUF736 family)
MALRLEGTGSVAPEDVERCSRGGRRAGQGRDREERRDGEGVAGKWISSDIRKVKTMNIGEIFNQNGRLTGSIATRTIDLPRIGLRKVMSENEKAPVYEILALNVARRWVQVGALWEAASKRTGEVFLAGNIDDPSLPEPLPIALFPADHGGYMVAWRRDTMRSDFGGSMGTSRTNYDDRGSRDEGGFGDSTAGADGELAGAGAPFGEEDPF